MKLHVKYEMEEDGRWIAEIPEMPGVMCYGASRNDAAAKVEALALRAIADRLDEGEMPASNYHRDNGKCSGMSQWPPLKARLVLAGDALNHAALNEVLADAALGTPTK